VNVNGISGLSKIKDSVWLVYFSDINLAIGSNSLGWITNACKKTVNKLGASPGIWNLLAGMLSSDSSRQISGILLLN
jgi:hypothetical protein